ncbi:hypothetical protein [Clostridium sp.]|uniref:hypothetical protein n=1 Tax=Clostridium sp. TaxID=1506 RepID=UPI0026250FCF|nr:hypothetical protein [Clostridium sp.]
MDSEFDVDIIEKHRIWRASKRWHTAYNNTGELRLNYSRKLNSGRPLNHELTIEEILAKKDSEIAYLKSKSELLKKIEPQERLVGNNKLNAASTFSIFSFYYPKINLSNLIVFFTLLDISVIYLYIYNFLQ